MHQRNLYPFNNSTLRFLDLRKAFDRVTQNIKKPTCKLVLRPTLLHIIQIICTSTRTSSSAYLDWNLDMEVWKKCNLIFYIFYQYIKYKLLLNYDCSISFADFILGAIKDIKEHSPIIVNHTNYWVHQWSVHTLTELWLWKYILCTDGVNPPISGHYHK